MCSGLGCSFRLDPHRLVESASSSRTHELFADTETLRILNQFSLESAKQMSLKLLTSQKLHPNGSYGYPCRWVTLFARFNQIGLTALAQALQQVHRLLL